MLLRGPIVRGPPVRPGEGVHANCDRTNMRMTTCNLVWSRGASMKRSLLVVAAIILAGGCVPGIEQISPQGHGIFQAYWLDKDVEEAWRAWGEHDEQREQVGAYVWWYHMPRNARCGRVLVVNDAGRITSARVTPNCPSIRTMLTMGWLPDIDPTGIRVDYERFRQVYRLATDPEIIPFDRGRFNLEASVVSEFHRDSPESLTTTLRLRAPDASGPAAIGQAGVLNIPVAGNLPAEARLLLDGDRAASALALERIPQRGLKSTDDDLEIQLSPFVDRMRLARSVEVLLPSGFSFELSMQHVDAIRRLLLLAWDPDKVTELARGPRLDNEASTRSANRADFP
jgi:hypothetical protein